jgi:multidrug efflux system membrane fusion protein
MDSDQANIDTAKLNIAYCHIVSPINGRIGLRLVDPGNYVQPSDASGLVVITEIDPISVVFSTPEDNLPAITARLNSGATLAATAFDRANVKQIATGTLTTFDNQVDVTTGTFKLRATFANPNGVLFPNQFVNVRLLVDTISGAVLAPNAAVQLGANGSFVYVVNENSTVSVRQVTTGPSDAQNTVIASGLAVGENVVIDGVDRLRDGAKVSVRNNANAAAQTPPTGSGAGQGQHRHRRDGQAPGGAATPANGSQ